LTTAAPIATTTTGTKRSGKNTTAATTA